MQRRRLGRTELSVTPLCLGGNVFGWTADERASFEVLDAYVEAGGNFIDTAEVYSRWVPGHQGGESEAVIGKWLASRGRPDGLVICTKVAPEGQGDEAPGLTRERVRAAVEGSLKRLGVEAIDLYLAHRDNASVPLEEVVATFDELVKEGKIRHAGGSNFSAERLASTLDLAEAKGLSGFGALQPEYNLLDRSEFEGPLAELCERRDVGVMTYYALASGFLSGKYREGQPLPESARAGSVKQKYMNPRGFRVLAAVDEVAKAHGATPARVALAWAMARPGVTTAIASATTAAQVADLVKATALTLSEDELRRLTAAGD